MERRTAQILKGIKNIPVDDIVRFIDDGEITRQQAIDAGLSPHRLAEVDKRRNVLEDERRKDAELKVAKTVREESAKMLLKDITAGRVDIELLQTHLKEGSITEDQLLSLPGMTNELVRAIWEFERRNTDFAAWDKLPPLKQGATDVFFFGLPGSGKTCILASLFHYMHREGLIVDDNLNPVGSRYRDQLRQEFGLGILPSRTVDKIEDHNTDKKKYILNYMPTGLRNREHGGVHPLNLLDMSGEMINTTYQQQDGPGTIWERGYLTSPNRKLLFFVVDYAEHERARRAKDGDQGSKLQAVLTLLDKKGILERTDGLYLLVSKADRFPHGSDQGQQAKDFLLREYRNFVENCRDLKTKYRDQFRITGYPYTIGEVRFGHLITSYNDCSPAFVVDRILHHAFRTRTSKLDRLGLDKRD